MKFEYDKVGNRTYEEEKEDSETTKFSYNYGQLNQLVDVKDDSNVVQLSYTYDNVGRTDTEMQYQDGNAVFESTYRYYDSGELRKVIFDNNPSSSSNATTSEDYYYNYAGQRTKKVGTETVKYTYSGGVQLFTTNHMGNLTTENILTPGGRIVASQRFNGTTPEGWYFYNNDVRGSTTTILDNDRTPEKEYKYDAFGNTEESGDLFNEIAFTGAVSDQSTGLYYMNARYYNSDTGRFLTQDSYKGNAYDPWTQHLYTYCGNNPINYIDPTGHIFGAIFSGLMGGETKGERQGSFWGAVATVAIVPVAIVAIPATGGAAALLIGAAVGATAGIVGECVGEAVEAAVDQDGFDMTWGEVAMAGGFGALGGVAGGAVTNAVVTTVGGAVVKVAGGNCAEILVNTLCTDVIGNLALSTTHTIIDQVDDNNERTSKSSIIPDETNTPALEPQTSRPQSASEPSIKPTLPPRYNRGTRHNGASSIMQLV